MLYGCFTINANVLPLRLYVFIGNNSGSVRVIPYKASPD